MALDSEYQEHAAFRELRLRHGLSQPQMASLLGVSSAVTIYRWETGRTPVPAWALRLAMLELGEAEPEGRDYA